MYASDAIEYRMVVSLKQNVRKISQTKDGLSEIMQNFFIQGIFRQLANPRTMREILFPGTNHEVLKDLPKNLQEVLSWKEIKLEYEEIARKGAEVLRNVQRKSNENMDPTTESIMLPQIALEALANYLVEKVRELSKKVSHVFAEKIQTEALLKAEELQHFEQQLDCEVIAQFKRNKYSMQEEYLGQEWSYIIRDDMRRFMRDEKMSSVDNKGRVVVNESNNIYDLNECSGIKIAWIEKQDVLIKEAYPALYEAILKLHQLPFEFNCKNA